MKVEEMSIDSYIRIYNYYENDKGYGNQIVENDINELLDMFDNFEWSEFDFFNFIKSSKYELGCDYVECGKNFMETISKKDIKNYVLNNILDNTLDGELKEIVVEELCNNGKLELIKNEN